MKRRRASRTQSRDELASHMGQRQRLEGHCQRLIALFADQTFPIMKKRHVATMEWFKDATKHLRLIVNINFSTKAIGMGILRKNLSYFLAESFERFSPRRLARIPKNLIR